MEKQIKNKLITYLSSFLSDERKALIVKNLHGRTRYVTVVLEDIYQSHNAGAIMRTCDALGVQDMHCIEKRNGIVVKRDIARGSSKWLTLKRYNGVDSHINISLDCIKKLKESGYKVVAMSPHATKTVAQLSLDTKIAFLFGTEETGLTQDAMDASDELVAIPMYGFVESFNVSVAVALCLYDITHRLYASTVNWGLSDDEKHDLQLDWMRASLEHVEILEREFLRSCQ